MSGRSGCVRRLPVSATVVRICVEVGLAAVALGDVRLEAPARPAVEGALEVVGHHLDELLAGEFRWTTPFLRPDPRGRGTLQRGPGASLAQASNRLALAVLLARGPALTGFTRSASRVGRTVAANPSRA